MKIFLETAFGAFVAIIVLQYIPPPFISIYNAFDVQNMDDKNKQKFITAFKGTFQSENPFTEDLDSEVRPSKTELSTYYNIFFEKTKLITPYCQAKKVIIPSRWANAEAKDREFLIFNTDNCPSKS